MLGVYLFFEGIYQLRPYVGYLLLSWCFFLVFTMIYTGNRPSKRWSNIDSFLLGINFTYLVLLGAISFI